MLMGEDKQVEREGVSTGNFPVPTLDGWEVVDSLLGWMTDLEEFGHEEGGEAVVPVAAKDSLSSCVPGVE
jgi:hypothetical protein